MPHTVYRGVPQHRATEDALVRLLVDGPTAFHSHATVTPYLFRDGDRTVGRCALIHDRNMPAYVQVAFFEALPGLGDVVGPLREAARRLQTGAPRLLVGLNGHLNYGAGILLDRFDEPPVFGMPYTPPYYPAYFEGLFRREMVSFRFPLAGVYEWGRMAAPRIDTYGITVRTLDMRRLRTEIGLYTFIDNTTFSNTPYWYWSNRDPRENYELFHPFRFLMRGENLLFAEVDGRPAGFLLWYPDFNNLVPAGRGIGPRDVLRYRFANPLRRLRLAEVAVLPEFRRRPVVAMMIRTALPLMERRGMLSGEGGFIFSENRGSIAMTQRYFERGIGHRLEPHTHYAMYEAEL